MSRLDPEDASIHLRRAVAGAKGAYLLFLLGLAVALAAKAAIYLYGHAEAVALTLAGTAALVVGIYALGVLLVDGRVAAGLGNGEGDDDD